jgi:nucleotide-binding universal stress UspA family protein
MNPTQTIQHILVAHDFHANSEAALQYAISLAKRLGARITVLHAYEVPSTGAPERLVMATDWVQQIGVVAGERLTEIATAARRPDVAIATELRQGAAWREIDSFAKEHAVDLVIVGSHGRHGLPRALLGSVAEKVVRTAPCPVLVVRGSSAE